MDIESKEALVLLLVEDLINLRNLYLLLAYVYIKLVVQPRQHRRGCLGALDGTYVPVGVHVRLHARYQNRKGFVPVNVLGACTQDMNFSYVQRQIIWFYETPFNEKGVFVYQPVNAKYIYVTM
ncbi:transposon protein, partial [Striga asiatica]